MGRGKREFFWFVFSLFRERGREGGPVGGWKGGGPVGETESSAGSRQKGQNQASPQVTEWSSVSHWATRSPGHQATPADPSPEGFRVVLLFF